jgi:hypothetical protein
MFNKTTLIIFLLFTIFIGCNKKSADYIAASYQSGSQSKSLQVSDDKIKPPNLLQHRNYRSKRLIF